MSDDDRDDMTDAGAAVARLVARAIPEHIRNLTPGQLAQRVAEIRQLEGAEARRLHDERDRARTGEFLGRCGVDLDKVELLTGARPPPCGKLRPDVKAWADAQRFAADPSKLVLVLVGPTGTGKSLAAASVFLSLRHRVTDPTWDGVASTGWRWASPGAVVTAPRLSRLPRYGPGSEELERLLAVPLLVLDDLGLETLALGDKLDELLDVRMGRRLRTVITANMEPAALAAKYGDRVADRLRLGGAVVVSICAQVGGRSLRQAGATP